MRLSVFGLGYVGCVSAACFAQEGNEVIGVDVNPTKAEIINGGQSPIVEAGVGELIGEVSPRGACARRPIRRMRSTTLKFHWSASARRATRTGVSS
jgi:UDP-glucose 6-dehydrogenase